MYSKIGKQSIITLNYHTLYFGHPSFDGACLKKEAM
jgi:hypothetical protein